MLGLRASEFVSVPFKSGVSVSVSPLALLELSPIDFQSQQLWGLIFLVQVPRVGMLNTGLEPFAPQEG